MARTTIAKTTPLGAYPALPLVADSADVNMQASTGASGTSGNQIAFSSASRLYILAQNTHASSPYTVTITSKVDGYNRTGDITTYSLAAGDIALFVVEGAGWKQGDGYVYLEATNAAVKFGAWEG